jgi:hypothetical protein
MKISSVRLQLNPLTDQLLLDCLPSPPAIANVPTAARQQPSAAGIFDDYVVQRPFTPPLAGLVSAPVLAVRVLGSGQHNEPHCLYNPPLVTLL